MKSSEFKKQLNRVFDDNLHTRQWENYVDYAIIGLILLSTLEVFLSTYDNIASQYGHILKVVDYVTTIAFTIEVSLRIWAADLIDPKYKGFWGRLKYCCTFYGLMDVLSTYPFYLHYFMPVPYVALKVLRIARLLRIFRYTKASSILVRALASKKDEMKVSLQFLIIVTIILSFILFFVEHEAQPDVYDNGWTSVVWAFMQYIGDPGNFADSPPVTVCGRVIACLIGVLGIAIFAVPAGLVASAFESIMEEDANNEKIEKNIHHLIRSFKFERDQHFTNLFHVPRYQSIYSILYRKHISELEIIEAVDNSECFHLYNLAEAVNKEDNPVDRVVLFNYYKNTPYGCCIDRNSNVTIVCTSGVNEPCTGWLAYHIAKIGGFNYVAKDIEVDIDNPFSYYNISDVNGCPNLQLFLDDINKLSNKPDSWVIPILSAMGPKSRPSQLHFCYNTTKHDGSYDDPKASVTNYDVFDVLYKEMEDVMNKELNLNLDKNEYYALNLKNIAYFIECKNVFTVRFECYAYLFAPNCMKVIKCFADVINHVLEPNVEKALPPEMLQRQVGHDFGMQSYIN